MSKSKEEPKGSKDAKGKTKSSAKKEKLKTNVKAGAQPYHTAS